MKTGTHTYYVIQFRRTHESPWGMPHGELKPIADEKWEDCGNDYWGINALENSKKDPMYYFYRYGDEASREFDEVLQATEDQGWWSLPIAVKIMGNLMQRETEGQFSSPDQAKKYEFGILRRTVSFKEEEVTLTDVAKEM